MIAWRNEAGHGKMTLYLCEEVSGVNKRKVYPWYFALGAVAIGTPYAAWTYGAANGNITLLAIGSYFTPVLSCLFASWWLDASLSAGFWQGVALVVAGSLLCWSSTIKRIAR